MALTLMQCRPCRLLGWEELKDGRCVVLRPKFGTSRVGQWLARRLVNPHYQIHLDEIGAFVWKACDGDTSVGTIVERMRIVFGANIEPAEARVDEFIQTLVRAKMLDLTHDC